MSTSAPTNFPLSWPMGWARTPAAKRCGSRFKKTSLGTIRDEMVQEFWRLGSEAIIVSTNIRVRPDQVFYANTPHPDDPGVAVYFPWRGKPHVIACDHYGRLWENVRAITKTIEALRTIERHGASQLLERATAGFRELGAGDAPEEEPEEPWWTVLDVTSGIATPIEEVVATVGHPWRKVVLSMAEAQYKIRIAKSHPDRGGSQEETIALNRAIGRARKELGTDGD